MGIFKPVQRYRKEKRLQTRVQNDKSYNKVKYKKGVYSYVPDDIPDNYYHRVTWHDGSKTYYKTKEDAQNAINKDYRENR